MAIDLYYYPGCPSCVAVLMTVRALGIKVTMHKIDLFKNEHHTEEYDKVNPLRKVPTIRDNGFMLYESRAIMLYLVRVYGDGNAIYPLDEKLRAYIDKFLFFDAGTLHMAIQKYWLPQVTPINASIETGLANRDGVVEALDQLESLIPEDTLYVTGDQCTLADISLISNVANLLVVGFDLQPWRKVDRWVNACKELDIYKEFDQYMELQNRYYSANKSAQ